MKRSLFYFLPALICAACILDGCRKNELQEEPGPPPEIYVRTPKVYPGEGGAFSLLFSIENPREGVEPELSSGESWIRDLAAGEGRITFTLAQNPSSTESRKGNIGISYKGAEPVSVEITQAGMDQAVITVKEPEVFGCEGGSGTIMYSIANPREGVGPEVSCEESWISGLSAGEGRITFTLSVNESVKSRKGTISISYMEAEPVSVEITQAGQDQSVIKVENPEAEFDYNGGSGSVKYSIEKPRDGDKLQATCSDSWITGITVGSGSISFKVSKNTDEAERNAEIELTYGNAEPAKIVVKQQEFIPAVIEVPETITLDAFDLKGSFTYSIRNPREGAQLKATSTARISDVTVTGNEITFSILFNANSSTMSSRIYLEYEDAQSVTVTVKQAASNPVALDIPQAANCYIVTEPGVYSFPAVKGSDRSLVVENIASVELLWCSSCLFPDNSGVTDYIDNAVYYRVNTSRTGNIFFRVPDRFSKGNAAIAAKDASGKILWSWHIWLPDDKPADQVYADGSGTVMDRNLGARVAGKIEDADTWYKSEGLLYQWGRKDPFPTVENTKYWFTHVDYSSTANTAAYTVANPMYFVKYLSLPDGSWQDGTKSVYDPCPPGYKVADASVWKKVPEVELSGSYDTYAQHHEFCISLSGILTGDPCWYALTTCRAEDGSRFRGKEGIYYWSTTKYGSSGDYVKTLFLRHYMEYYVWYYRIQSSCQSSKGRGLPVRCQRISY